jgi:hypothetical protein
MIPTISALGAALRGLPRAADIYLRLPDGSSARIAMVEGHNTGLAGSLSSQEPGGYRVVFVVEAEGGKEHANCPSGQAPGD